MGSDFANVYEDRDRAASYAKLEFPGTYHLAYRDLPAIIAAHAPRGRALDFGCGTGRSTRFVKSLGFEAVGVDISAEMLDLAREADPGGDYRLSGATGPAGLGEERFDLVLSVFTFDNIPTVARKIILFRELGRLLAPGGRLVNLVSSPEIYVNEWASFTTREFPANRKAKSGDEVMIVMTDVADRRPVKDVIFFDDAYREVFRRAGLEVVATERPLGRGDEPFAWVSETTIAPWVIYVLRAAVEG
jgi:SAM-dependent methyltransferase